MLIACQTRFQQDDFHGLRQFRQDLDPENACRTGLHGAGRMLGKRMRKLVPFLACLMLVLTTWAGMAHAAEAGSVGTSRIEMAVHAPGDGDEVPADGDKGYPHHHASCHEHNVNTPIVRAATIPVSVASAVPLSVPSRTLSGHDTEADLRPPQA